MMTISNEFILITIAVPLIGALIIAFLDKMPVIRDIISVIFTIITFACVYLLFRESSLSSISALEVIKINKDLSIAFAIDSLGIIFALMASFLWILTTLYACGYVRTHHTNNQTRFFVFFAIAISATLGVAFSGNLFSLFLFYELLSLSTYPLVTHNGTALAKKSGRTYLGVLLSGSMLFFLPAIVLVLLLTESLNFTSGGLNFYETSPYLLIVIMLLFLFGIAKSAIMPMHAWLPAAMVAPTPVSALLHAVAVVKSGVFAFIKVMVYIIGIDNLKVALQLVNLPNFLMMLPAFTIVFASILALKQDNLKKRLAYSTISQLSYILFAILLLAPKSVLAATTHMIFHGFAKITLFFAAGAIIALAHKQRISEMGGLAKKMPFTMIAFSIGAFAMIGLPLTSTFISKWLLISAALEVDNIIALITIILSTVLNTMYFFPILFIAFFGKEMERPSEVIHEVREIPIMSIPMLISALITVLLFFYSSHLINILRFV